MVHNKNARNSWVVDATCACCSMYIDTPTGAPAALAYLLFAIEVPLLEALGVHRGDCVQVPRSEVLQRRLTRNRSALVLHLSHTSMSTLGVEMILVAEGTNMLAVRKQTLALPA